MPDTLPLSPALAARQRWMGILAKARLDEIEAVWAGLGRDPGYDFLRRPEIGLLLVRGRMGGEGRPFNFGEVTATRCSVRLDNGRAGHATVLGRAPRHAELAALLDALLQEDESLSERVTTPLDHAQRLRKREVAKKAAATRVDFFTLVRGEG